MTPSGDSRITSESIKVRRPNDMTGEEQVIKVLVPKVRMEPMQFWGIIGGILGAAGIVAALLAAFFVSKADANTAHTEMRGALNTHVTVDNRRDQVQDSKDEAIQQQMRAVEHNLIKIGERVRARDLKTADDFDEGAP